MPRFATLLLLVIVAAAGAACRRSADVEPSMPAGWRCVEFASALTLSVPPGAEFRDDLATEGRNGVLLTKNFRLDLMYGPHGIEYGPSGGLSRWKAERRIERQITIHGRPVVLARIELPPEARTEQAPVAFSPYRLEAYIEDAGPGRTRLVLEAACSNAEACDEAEQVVRSIEFLPYVRRDVPPPPPPVQ